MNIRFQQKEREQKSWECISVKVRTKLVLVCLLSCFLSLVGPRVLAQKSPQIMLELGGWAPYYSLNFLKPIYESDKIIGSLRMGGSISPEHLAMPFGVLFHNRAYPHQWQAGLGLSFISEGLKAWDRDHSDILVRTLMDIGYRYQAQGNDFFFVVNGIFYFLADPEIGDLFKIDRRPRMGASIQIGKRI